MMMYMLSEALDDIENLQSYYKSQKDHVDEHVKEKIKCYKYGIAIDKYFLKQVSTDSDELSLTPEEQEIIGKIIDEFVVEDKDEGKIVKYRLNPNEDYKGQVMDPSVARKGYIKLIQQPRILRESIIMMLLIKYEESIANIFRFLIKKYPQAYLSDKSITYSELLSSESNIDAIKEKLINKQVEEIMRMPISDWYKMLETKHKAKFGFENDAFEHFKEVYYRRNLIVHNQGIVNETYKNSVINEDADLGSRLPVNVAYIKKSLMYTRKILIGTFWGLRKSTDEMSLHSYIFEYGYNCLIKKEWELAEYVFSILLKEENKNNADKMLEQINMWIAIKNGKGLEAIREEVEQLDVSAMNTQFVVAKYALLNDYDMVSQYLEISIEKDIPSWCIKEWPLFLQYRESEQYIGFVEKHKDVLQTKGYESDKQSMDNPEETFAKLNEINEDDNAVCEDTGFETDDEHQ